MINSTKLYKKLLYLYLTDNLYTENIFLAYYNICRLNIKTIKDKNKILNLIKDNFIMEPLTKEELDFIDSLSKEYIHLDNKIVKYIHNNYLDKLKKLNLICPNNISPKEFLELIGGYDE